MRLPAHTRKSRLLPEVCGFLKSTGRAVGQIPKIHKPLNRKKIQRIKLHRAIKARLCFLGHALAGSPSTSIDEMKGGYYLAN
jgi:hypothetical protein